MQRLILLRHAKTESVSASGGDIDRALTDRGREDAALMARVLAAVGATPDRVLVSTALRARQTWEVMAASFPAARMETDALLYLASATRLAHVLDADADMSDSVMLVGHNPGLHELAIACARSSPGADRERLMEGFPTAAAAVFTKGADGQWSLEHSLSPRAHRGAGS
jgi:phosphohistidine phosphatase